MKITLLAHEVGSPTSGQSRFLLNLAAGLRREGVSVGVAATAVLTESRTRLEAIGVKVEALRAYRDWTLSKALLITPQSHEGRKVARMATRRLPGDWYVVLADGAVDAGAALPSRQSVYISNGDLALMLMSEAFFSTHALSKSLLALTASRFVRRNAAFAATYRVLIANSEFTRGLMSFLYSIPFTGVVHPPVDLEVFHPNSENPSTEPYVLAVARNANEQGIPLLRDLAQRLPLHVVGGATVPEARNLGVVSDGTLRSEYAGASFLMFPVVSELFGYAVVESLACGTPVLAFRNGGPAEQVRDGQTGWLVSARQEALDRSITLFREGFPTSMRAAARKSAERFSMKASAQALLSALPG
jgi:glycosyltransferase involved in cell wall biosynthesis